VFPAVGGGGMGGGVMSRLVRFGYGVIIAQQDARRERPNWGLASLMQPAGVAPGAPFAIAAMLRTERVKQQSSRLRDPVDSLAPPCQSGCDTFVKPTRRDVNKPNCDRRSGTAARVRSFRARQRSGDRCNRR
jgi:hypothetical protein